jgi:virginiamycin B lyase
MRSLTRSIALVCVAFVPILAACNSGSSPPPAPTPTVPQPAFTAFAVPYLTQAERAPIIEGPDRALWFAEGHSTGSRPSLIGRITAAGMLMQFPRGASGSAAVSGFTNGSDGNVYFGQQPPIMGRITPGGVASDLPLPSAGAIAVTTGSDGAVWFTENSISSPEIARLDPAGNVAKFPIPSSLITFPAWIAAGPDGALWVADAMGPHIVRVNVTGAVSAIAIPAAVRPSGIVAGPDGAMWFADGAANQLGRVAIGSHAVTFFPTSPVNIPQLLTSGPDGALWFVDDAGAAIGRLTTSGALSTFTVPPAKTGAGVFVGGMAAGPDQAIWFTDLPGNRVCRLSVTAPLAPAVAARVR